MPTLANRVALITGSTSGIGKGMAEHFATLGAKVVVHGRDAQAGARLVEAIRSRGGDAAFLGGDIADEAFCVSLVQGAVDRFGGLDVLVNCVALARGGGLLETADAEWQAAFDHTLLPAVRASRLAVPHMTRRGGGSIIIIASIFGREAGGRMTYNAVKAAEISLAKSLAQQLAPSNIRVNSVSPGSFLFEGGSWWKRQQENPVAIADYVKRELPFGRFGRADELGDVVAFLASSRASWISGTSIVVDGCQSRSF